MLRFYIALTVFANLGYAFVAGLFFGLALVLESPYAFVLVIVPGMISTGFAVLSTFGVREAVSLHEAIQSTGRALELPHIAHSLMLPAQTLLTLIFHALLAMGLFAFVFFRAVGLV